MSDVRDAVLLVATGAQDIGKTYTTVKQMLITAYAAKHKRKGLIFDTNGNEMREITIDNVKHRIQTIPHNKIIEYSNFSGTEVRRISPFYPNGAPMSVHDTEQLLFKVLQEYRNGILLVDDLNKLYADAMPKEVTGALISVRHRSVDTCVNLQAVGRLTPKLLQNVKILRYHYQIEPIAKSADKLKGQEEIFYITEAMVNKQYDSGNRRFFVYIYTMDKKIKGAFSPKMLSDAIVTYLSENPRELNTLLRTVDIRTGKKLYDYQTAFLIKVNELYQKYQGNPRT